MYVVHLCSKNTDAKGSGMPSAVMTTRGRITLPASVRAVLGLAMGDQVEFILAADGQYSIVAARPELGR